RTRVRRSRTSRASSRAWRWRRCSTKRYEPGRLSGSLSESPMPIRSGAMQRPRGCRCGSTLRQRYDEVGLPCSSTMGSPRPTSTYAISLPRTRCRCFLYGNAAEIMFASPSLVVVPLSLLPLTDSFLSLVRSRRADRGFAPARKNSSHATGTEGESDPSKWHVDHIRDSVAPWRAPYGATELLAKRRRSGGSDGGGRRPLLVRGRASIRA